MSNKSDERETEAESDRWIVVPPAEQPGPDLRADGLHEPLSMGARGRDVDEEHVDMGGPPNPAGVADESITGSASNHVAVEDYAIGGGWYQFDDGTKVQGRDQAVAHLQSM